MGLIENIALTGVVVFLSGFIIAMIGAVGRETNEPATPAERIGGYTCAVGVVVLVVSAFMAIWRV